jgi:CubicO group peptidase (beta-lactamase class C family)
MNDLERLAERLPTTAKQIAAGLDRLHPGVQLFVSLRGEPIAEAAIGQAEAGVSLTVDHLMPWLSAGKPLTAFAMLQQVDAGRVELDTPVVAAIPEFAAQGKSAITLRHLLTHTAGLQPIPTGWPREPWPAIIERICSAKLRHGATPGATPAYDPVRTWFLLGEWLRRLTGLEVSEALEACVCGPLELASATWINPRQPVAPERLARLHRCDESGCLPEPEQRMAGIPPSPGSSFRAPARELGRFYEMLLRRGQWRGRQLLSPTMVQAMTTRQRIDQFDFTSAKRCPMALAGIARRRPLDTEVRNAPLPSRTRSTSWWWRWPRTDDLGRWRTSSGTGRSVRRSMSISDSLDGLRARPVSASG